MVSKEYLQWLAPSSRKLERQTGDDGQVPKAVTALVKSRVSNDFNASGSSNEECSVYLAWVNAEAVTVKNTDQGNVLGKTDSLTEQETGSQRRQEPEREPSQKTGAIEVSVNPVRRDVDSVCVGQAEQRAGPPTEPGVGGGLGAKKTRQRLILPQHVVTVENPGCKVQYLCHVCGRAFQSRCLIKQHVTHTDADYPHQCNLCPRRFFTSTHLKYHQRCHANERPYECGECGKAFKQRGALNRHQEIHSTTRDHVCQECSKAFKTKDCLKSHKRLHAAGPRKWQCICCPSAFTSKAGLLTHVSRAKTGPHRCVSGSCERCLKKPAFTIRRGKRPHQCKECPRSFATPKDLERHLRQHTGEKPYPCKVCGTTFARQDNAERHVMISHGQPKKLARQLVLEGAEEYRECEKQDVSNRAS